jgi:outer membrane protein assembly factor BamB
MSSGLPLRVALALTVLVGFSVARAGQVPDVPSTKKEARGLTGEYFSGPGFKTFKSKHVDPRIHFQNTKTGLASRVGGSKTLSIRWSGQFKSTRDGFYVFYLSSEGLARLWVDGKLLVDHWKRHGAGEKSGRIRMRSDRWYDIQIDYEKGNPHSRGLIRLEFKAPKARKIVVPPALLRPVYDIRDPYPEAYKAPPSFVAAFNQRCERSHHGRYRAEFKKRMDQSFEPTFFSLCDLSGYSKPEPRSTALVRAALARERKGEYRSALEIYQKIIEETPNDLYRTSKYGIYVPVSQYCQRRILRFPVRDRAFYRTKFDAQARVEYQQARRKNSREGMAQIVERMLATSYGGKAVLALGDGALDRGHFLEALEYYLTVRDTFTDRDLHTPDLMLKIAYCRKMLGDSPAGKSDAPGKSLLSAGDLARFKAIVNSARPSVAGLTGQRTSASAISADDYTRFPPTSDPLALKSSVWSHSLPGTRLDNFVYTQPVIAGNSVLYRHKNIIYSRSILTGELRWKNHLGGRVAWQNWHERQYPQEDLLVQDGLVFAPMIKVGPTLVALDETTGQLKWAYGPMVASNPEEAAMRFEAAPAGGPRTVYAGYVLDNIEGKTHIDSEYGVMAFESTTGVVRWRRPICRLKPGLFTAGFAESRSNRIHSFTSPPLYSQGTVFYNTNAGAIVALDALSGRVKWSMRYPYNAFPHSVHDATREFGRLKTMYGGMSYVRPHFPMFWLNQRPLLSGEQLYVLPVDSPYMFCIDRRSGAVRWTRTKFGEGFSYFLGPMSNGDLVVVTNGRNSQVFGSSGSSGPPILLLDPKTGKTKWKAPDLITVDPKPVMKNYHYNSCIWFGMNNRWFENAARPFLTSDDKLYVANWTDVSIWWRPGMHVFHLAEVDLKSKKVTARRRFYSDATLVHAESIIRDTGPKELKLLTDIPNKNKKVKAHIAQLKSIVADTPPENRYPPFRPFSRVTFKRYGQLFELRISPRSIELVYDRQAVKRVVASRKDPQGLFARAELAVGESRLRLAAGLMQQCLKSISSEDVDFRSIVNQQLYRAHRRLARSAVRSGQMAEELLECRGMRQTVNTLAEEIETLFALAEAYQRKGDLETSSRLLRSIISTYGHYRYPRSSIFAGGQGQLTSTTKKIIAAGKTYTEKSLYASEFNRVIALMDKGLALYFSALSPLKKDLTARTGELAAARLIAMQKSSKALAEKFEKMAAAVLNGRPAAEQLYRLWEFPGTRVSQQILKRLFSGAGKEGAGSLAEQAARRKRLWQLADAARICGLKVPQEYNARVLAPAGNPRPEVLSIPGVELPSDLGDARGTAWLICQRKGQRQSNPDMMFLAGRVRKKFDNKFILRCRDIQTGKTLWDASEQRGGRWFKELRLKGKGSEPGFADAFVYRDVVVVHGLYDVLAFKLADGKLKWRYRVPFNFEIRNAVISGGLLVLSGKAETLALFLGTGDPRGEVAWQEGEEGALYMAPYFHGDRLVSVRKLPFSVTVRYRATGKLIGRLQLPDLSLNFKHPLIKDGPLQPPADHDGRMLVVTDSWYYIAVDILRMKVIWKRLIDNNNPASEPTIRFCLQGDYLAVVKNDFDAQAIYMLSSASGKVLWNTDAKKGTSPRPLYSMMIKDGLLMGIKIHPGQSFYFAALDCKTGKERFRPGNQGKYGGKPQVALLPYLFGKHVVVRVKDRQDFQLKVLDVTNGKTVRKLQVAGTGNFGEGGRASASVQNGVLMLLGKNQLKVTRAEK